MRFRSGLFGKQMRGARAGISALIAGLKERLLCCRYRWLSG
ncbi:hypothetical protein [Cyclonatronum sp.]|nr:hypothetical protein [Cyclonatronum sp.]